MKIIKYGLNSRIWFRDFERKLYTKIAPELKPTYYNCKDFLGKSISFFIFENERIKNLCLFDADDGSGLKEDSCKINYNSLTKLIKKNNVNDYLIFKLQLNKNYPYSKFYKDIKKTIPLGYFPSDFDNLKKKKKKQNIRKRFIWSKKEKDIDIFWIGTVKYDIGEGMVWPKNLSLKYWNYGKRIAAFQALKQISNENKNLRIICSDRLIPPKDYFKLVLRSKICIDFPGVGEFTRRFIENLILGKCVLGFPKLQDMHFNLKENIHYLSFDEEDDINYSFSSSKSSYSNSIILKDLKISPKISLINKMKNKIDEIFNNPEIIKTIEFNVLEAQKFFSPDYIISYIEKKALQYFS